MRKIVVILGVLALVGGAGVAEGRRFFLSTWCVEGDVLYHGGECYIFVQEIVSRWSGNRLQELLLLRELLGFRTQAQRISNVTVYHLVDGKLTTHRVKGLEWDAGFYPVQGVPCRMSAHGSLQWTGKDFEPMSQEQVTKDQSYRLLSDLLKAEGWSKYQGVPNFRESEGTYRIRLTGGEYTLKVTKHQSSGYVKSFVMFGPGLSPDGEKLGDFSNGDWVRIDKQTYENSFPK